MLGKIMVLEEARDGWSRRPRYDLDRGGRARHRPRPAVPQGPAGAPRSAVPVGPDRARTPAASSPCSATRERTALVDRGDPRGDGGGGGRRVPPTWPTDEVGIDAAPLVLNACHERRLRRGRGGRGPAARRARAPTGRLGARRPLEAALRGRAPPHPPAQADALLRDAARSAPCPCPSCRCPTCSARSIGRDDARGSWPSASRRPDAARQRPGRRARARARRAAHPRGLRLGRRRQDDDGRRPRPARRAPRPARPRLHHRPLAPARHEPRPQPALRQAARPRPRAASRPARGGALCRP